MADEGTAEYTHRLLAALRGLGYSFTSPATNYMGTHSYYRGKVKILVQDDCVRVLIRNKLVLASERDEVDTCRHPNWRLPVITPRKGFSKLRKRI